MITHKALHPSIFIFLVMALISMTRVLAADLLNDPILEGGEISYTPPFSMPHNVQDDSVTYLHGENIAISFHVIDFGFGPEPHGADSFADTNAVSIDVMRRAVEAANASSFVGTNVVAKIIKVNGRDAVEIYGKRKGFGGPEMWADTIVMFWHKGTRWSNSSALGIAVTDENADDCQKLIESVKSAKYHLPDSVPVSGADLLNDPIFGGGQISYSPPFFMPHNIAESVEYRIRNTEVSFKVRRVKTD